MGREARRLVMEQLLPTAGYCWAELVAWPVFNWLGHAASPPSPRGTPRAQRKAAMSKKNASAKP